MTRQPEFCKRSKCPFYDNRCTLDESVMEGWLSGRGRNAQKKLLNKLANSEEVGRVEVRRRCERRIGGV